MKSLNELIDAVKNYKEKFPEDMFCFGQADLLEFIPFEHIKEMAKDGVTEEEWNKDVKELSRQSILKMITDYLPFALGKADDHRGLSAGRSINHFQTWIWILDDYDKINWTKYQNYGVPILKQICELYGYAFPDDNATLVNMSCGERCSEDCEEGCGQ